MKCMLGSPDQTYENDHGPWLDHDPIQSQNDRDLVQHTAKVSGSIETVIAPSTGNVEDQIDVDVLGEIENTLLPILQTSMPGIPTILAVNDVSFPALQVGVPTIATNVAHETRCGDPKPRGKPKSDFC